MKKINMKWAKRVLVSNSFLVVTDTDAALWLDIRNPRKLTNVVTLQYQRATLKLFMRRLQSLIREHDKALEKARNRAKVDQRPGKETAKPRKGS